MADHARNDLDDGGDRSNRSASPRALLANEEIEALLGPGSSAASGTTGDLNQSLPRTEEAISEPSMTGRRSSLPNDVRSFCLTEFSADSSGVDLSGLTTHGDAQLELRVELGRTYVNLDESRRLRRGSVVSLDCAADEPVAIYANNRLVARGELLVMQETFCVRILELVAATMAKAG